MYSLGYNSFWSFGSAAVQELLTKTDVTLDELLEEDGLILEVKNQNQNLYTFILKEDNFKQLIQCAISIPDVEKLEHNQKKCYKFPFTCADILSSDSQPIVSAFFKSSKDIREDVQKSETVNEDDDEVNVDTETTDKEGNTTGDQTIEEGKENTEETQDTPYLDYLFSFLDSETLNLTSAGYFAKIVNNLLNKKSSELIAYIYERRPDLLQKMVKHIYSKSIAEFLAKVLTFESSVLANPGNEVYNDKRSEVLKEIIKKLQPDSDLEEINNTAYLICEVFGKYNTMHCSHEILNNLLEKAAIDYFFEILKSGKSASACAVALILGNIFAYYILINTPKPQEIHDDNSEYHPQQLELNDNIPLLAAFIENLEEIVKFIGGASSEGFPGQYGANAIPFGSARLKVLELIIIAMKANNKKIYEKLIQSDFLETLFKVFVKHDWNNMLHNQVEKILTHILEGNSEDLKRALFEKAKVLDFIVEASKDTEYTLGRYQNSLNLKIFITTSKHSRKVRRGYLGHLVRLSNKIVESKDPIAKQATEGHRSWKEYVETILAETNQRDKVNFGGRDPRQPRVEEDVRLELPKFTRLLNLPGTKAADQRKKPAEKTEDEKKEDEDEDENEEIVEDIKEEKSHDHHPPALATSEEFIEETEKQVLKVSSPKAQEDERVKPATVPIRGRHTFDVPTGLPSYDEELKEKNESEYVLDAASIKTVEETLDPNFLSNVYWKRSEMFSADDVLSEIEGMQ